ncbi:MAG: 30S ribosomal protein S11 [Patescibacteria group bacterium]
MEDEVKTSVEETSAAPVTEAASDAPKAKGKPTKKVAGKKKAVRKVSQGRAYIQSTFNNTIVTLTDANGNTLAWASAGHCGFSGPKKATPYAASTIVKTVADKVAEMGLKELAVYVKGIGAGRDSALRALNANGFNVLSIKDETPVPHNGCRLAGRRRM